VKITISFESEHIEDFNRQLGKFVEHTTGIDDAEMCDTVAEVQTPPTVQVQPAAAVATIPPVVAVAGPPVEVPQPLSPQPPPAPVAVEFPSVPGHPEAAPAATAGYVSPEVEVVGAQPTIPLTNTLPAGAEMATDSAGLAWDTRIHSETPSLKKDGKWRMKRGLASKPGGPELIASVEAELRGGVVQAPVLTPTTVLPPAALPAPPLPPTDAGADSGAAITLAAAILAHATTMGDDARSQAGAEMSAIMDAHNCPGGLPDLLQQPGMIPGVLSGLQVMAGPDRWNVPSA